MFLHFLQHEAIHASIQAFEAQYVAEKIEVGLIYKIDDFYVDTNRANFRVVPHPAKINLARNTISHQLQKMYQTSHRTNSTSLNLINCGPGSM